MKFLKYIGVIYKTSIAQRIQERELVELYSCKT